MAPISIAPNQVLLSVNTVDRWAFGVTQGLRLHGWSEALTTCKPTPGAVWTLGRGFSGPSPHQGDYSGDSHQSGGSSGDSGQRTGEPPVKPQGSSPPTRERQISSDDGRSGGGKEQGGKDSVKADPSAFRQGESGNIGAAERERMDIRNIEAAVRTLEDERKRAILMDKTLFYVLMPVEETLQHHFEHHPTAQSIYKEAMGWLAV